MTGDTRLALSVALGQLVIVLDTTIAVVAVPTLMREFDAPLSTVQWVTVGYVLALVATMPLCAWVTARCGGRTAYVSAMVVFAVASILAGRADSIGALIAVRVLMGLAGGFIGPIGMSLALSDVDAGYRGRVGALLGLPVLIGPVLGPITAGWLVDAVSWRAIFWVVVPPAVLAAALVRRFAPGRRTEGRPPALDVLGLALLVPGVVALVFGVGDATLPAGARIGIASAGALAVAVFVRRSWFHEAPLVGVRLLAESDYGRAFAVAALFAAAYFGSMLIAPTYVQVARGDGALLSGLIAMPAGLATGVSLQVCTRLIDKVSAHRVVTTGLIVSAVAVLCNVVVLQPDTPYALFAATSAMLGLGSGAVLMPTMTTAMRYLHGADLDSGSTMLALTNQVAAALGNSVVVAVYTGVAAVTAGTMTSANGQVAALRWALLIPLALIVIAIPVAWRLRPQDLERQGRRYDAAAA